jgi:hypothetical protein
LRDYPAALAAANRISCEVDGRRVPTIEGNSMRKLISLTMMGVLAMGLGIGINGCSDEAGTKTTTTTTSPEGKSTVTTEKSVKTSGENPPAPNTKP